MSCRGKPARTRAEQFCFQPSPVFQRKTRPHTGRTKHRIPSHDTSPEKPARTRAEHKEREGRTMIHRKTCPYTGGTNRGIDLEDFTEENPPAHWRNNLFSGKLERLVRKTTRTRAEPTSYGPLWFSPRKTRPYTGGTLFSVICCACCGENPPVHGRNLGLWQNGYVTEENPPAHGRNT